MRRSADVPVAVNNFTYTLQTVEIMYNNGKPATILLDTNYTIKKQQIIKILVSWIELALYLQD